MRCNTFLCGNQAQFINLTTKEKKCERCKNKRLDCNSASWFELKELPKPENLSANLPNKYRVDKNFWRGETHWFVYHDQQGDAHAYSCSSESEAQAVCAALNKAYKLAVIETLLKLNSFSLDIRRQNGIVWGDGSTAQNANF